MTPDAPNNQKGVGDFLLLWLPPILLLILGFVVWSDHVQAGFHADDFPVIVNNRAIRSLTNIPRFFTQTRAFSSEPEFADYKPLLLTSYALDASLSKVLNPLVFQLDSLAWFALLVGALYGLFRLIPNTGHELALVATGLFGLHPIAAQTVNYVSQRGQILAALGTTLALAFWIIWPRRLPQSLGLNLDRVPQTWWQDQIRQKGAGWEARYRAFLRLRLPFYLIPLVPSLLCDPSAAFFIVLLFAWTWIYDKEKGFSRLLPAALICVGYWVIQTVLTWRASPLFRVSFFSYWLTQPWVCARYLYSFFVPAGLVADSDFRPLNGFWPPFALAGLAALAGLIWLACRLQRHFDWRGVAFGIWWFLIALLPGALIPQRAVEANPRMFFASAGLAFACAHLGRILYRRAHAGLAEGRQIAAASLAGSLGLAIAGTLGWMTWDQNQVWANESTLWLDVTTKNPGHARGLIRYAAALATADEPFKSLNYLQRATPLVADDALLELQLAQGFDRLNKDVDAEFHFRRALQLAPQYSAANSWFGQWLMARQRATEALSFAKKGQALNATDLVSRHTLMDYYSQQSDWVTVIKLANETLAIDPDDPEGKRSLLVAQASVDQVEKAETDVKNSPTVDECLKLAVLYYHNRRYEDSIKASRQALQLRPNLAEAWANIAAADHTMGRDDEAITALREVIRLRPDMEFARVDLEILLEKQKGLGGR